MLNVVFDEKNIIIHECLNIIGHNLIHYSHGLYAANFTFITQIVSRIDYQDDKFKKYQFSKVIHWLFCFSVNLKCLTSRQIWKRKF